MVTSLARTFTLSISDTLTAFLRSMQNSSRFVCVFLIYILYIRLSYSIDMDYMTSPNWLSDCIFFIYKQYWNLIVLVSENCDSFVLICLFIREQFLYISTIMNYSFFGGFFTHFPSLFSASPAPDLRIYDVDMNSWLVTARSNLMRALEMSRSVSTTAHRPCFLAARLWFGPITLTSFFICFNELWLSLLCDSCE